jgi:hypothetical protein
VQLAIDALARFGVVGFLRFALFRLMMTVVVSCYSVSFYLYFQNILFYIFSHFDLSFIDEKSSCFTDAFP